MSAIMNTAQITSLLKRGVKKVWGTEDDYAPEWPHIYKTEISDKDVEPIIEYKPTGLMEVKVEGGPTTYDSAQEAYRVNVQHTELSLGFIVTERAKEDNLYEKEFPRQVEMLKKSARETKERLAMSVFNNALNTLFPLGDGLPLLSTNRPLIAGGTYSNTLPVQADLQETTVEQAIILMGKMKDQAGNIRKVLPKKIFVGINNMFNIKRITKSEYTPASANNSRNIINLENIFPEVVVSHYMIPQNSWFILSDQDGFLHFQRRPLRHSIYQDFDTDNHKYKVTERYSFVCFNPRAVVGCYLT
jgi:hypothetical protein